MTFCASYFRSLLIGICCFLVGTFGAAAEPEPHHDWPQWRGPTFDAISGETDLADEWPAAGPPVLWSRQIGQGYSSFIAVGNRVFTQTQTLYEQAVVCLDADTGETIWSTRYGWPYEGGGLYPGPRSTPAWHDGKIYYAAPDGTIGCLNATSGTAIWSTNPTKQFRGRGTDFGYSSSPVVIDGKVIVPVGGDGACVVALSALDGTVVWSAGDSSASYASVLPITVNGQSQIIASLENSLAAFDLKSGMLLWEEESSNGYDEHSAAPLYREPLLMVAGPFRAGAKCVRLPSEPSGRPTRVWDAPKFSNDIASSVLYNDRIYGFDLRDPQSRLNRPSRGEYRCLDFETGRILWSTDQAGHANTIVADSKLILFNDKGEVILARLGTDEYEELARAQVFEDEICWSPAALSRGRLFLRTQSRAVCLYLGKHPLESKKPVQTIAAIPRSSSFNPTPLLGGEREYPATTPEWSEFGLWYLCSLAAILLASALAIVIGLIEALVRYRSRTNSTTLPETTGSYFSKCRPEIVFWSTILAAGLFGSPLLNRWQDEYIFLWPLVLWSSLQLTVLATTWAERQPNRKSARWVSRLAGFAFIGVSGLYFHLCRRLGMSIEWGFLTGYLPGFPVAALAAWISFRVTRRRWLILPLCAFVSFTACYSAGMLFIKWWLRMGS